MYEQVDLELEQFAIDVQTWSSPLHRMPGRVFFVIIKPGFDDAVSGVEGMMN